MREYEKVLADHDVDVKIVTFDEDVMAQAYVRQTKLSWPLLIDQEKELYRGYGLRKASWWQLYRPRSIIRYLALMIRGVRPGQPGSDWQQLGGNVVIDPQSRVALLHMSEDPHDRPPVAELLKLVGVEPTSASSRD